MGQESREFVLKRRQLSTISDYFAERLDASQVNFVQRNAQLNALWLEDFDPEMFELFVYWLEGQHQGDTPRAAGSFFGPLLEEAEAQHCCDELHWDLINLHLFGSRIGLASLQDAAMDAIQDLYLLCDWDVTPRMVSYIYTECEPAYSFRLRKWAVAMAAWSLGNADVSEELNDGAATMLRQLFEACPIFREDYVAHLSKSCRNRIRLQFKNPQLRLPTNALRNEERQFGYRQCSFHTHRSSVGQGRCPHDAAVLPLALSKPLPLTPRLVEPQCSSDEDSDLELLGPVPGSRRAARGPCSVEANTQPTSPMPYTAVINMYLDIH